MIVLGIARSILVSACVQTSITAPPNEGSSAGGYNGGSSCSWQGKRNHDWSTIGYSHARRGMRMAGSFIVRILVHRYKEFTILLSRVYLGRYSARENVIVAVRLASWCTNIIIFLIPAQPAGRRSSRCSQVYRSTCVGARIIWLLSWRHAIISSESLPHSSRSSVWSSSWKDVVATSRTSNINAKSGESEVSPLGVVRHGELSFSQDGRRSSITFRLYWWVV